MDDDGYDDDDFELIEDGNFKLIEKTELIVQRDEAPLFVASSLQFYVDSESEENAQLLLDPFPALRARYAEIGPDFTLTVLRTNAHVKRKGPHRSRWQVTIVPESKHVEATVYRVPPNSPAP